MVDPRRLMTFQRVVALGSFSRAAKNLLITQSAVSQQIAALERQSGAQLLHRGPEVVPFAVELRGGGLVIR